ncbi:PREDICTED: elastin-like [Priapulus caudatus]|uniref:Elastin-like n=1 Tax=Priapulus caudatus TaxID=37621 RepID=A0ABM1F1N3_PRICU|nr:PREDICTED: elastin-like [Priapulus caudatus]
MKLTLLTFAVVIVATVRADGYGSTQAPGYFTTQVYGPVSSGGLRGLGERKASLSYDRSGTAIGTAYNQDQATADQTAAKSREYDYNYRSGYNYEQPKTLYNYDINEQIWGLSDNSDVYTGEGATSRGLGRVGGFSSGGLSSGGLSSGGLSSGGLSSGGLSSGAAFAGFGNGGHFTGLGSGASVGRGYAHAQQQQQPQQRQQQRCICY